MRDDLVVAVAAVYRQSDAELICFLREVSHVSYPAIELVLVNNEPGRQLKDVVAASGLRPVIVNSDRNVGFTGAVNQGIRHALARGAGYVLMLNTDIHILSRDLVERMQVPFSQDAATGLVSPIIVQHPAQDRLWYAGATVNRRFWFVRHRGLGGPLPPERDPFRTQAICGCCALISTSVFRRVGLLDDRLFMYFEDADLSVRATESGFHIYVVPPALVAHEKRGNRMSAVQTYWGGRNVLMLAQKYQGRRFLALAGQVAISPTVLLRAKGLAAKAAYFKGMAEGMRRTQAKNDGNERRNP